MRSARSEAHPHGKGCEMRIRSIGIIIALYRGSMGVIGKKMESTI